MTILQAIILGVAQGLTEFIPVSSSGHLVLLHDALNVTESGLIFDVALHLGTLLALVFYFFKDIKLLLLGLLGKNSYQRVAWLIAAATVPAVLAGMALEDAAESTFRSTRLVAINLIVVAFFMLAAEHFARRYKHPTELKRVSPKQALLIGLAQAAAIVPGVSRSGSTITTGLFAGLERVAATRFAFLLGIPITAGATAKVLLNGDALARINGELDVFVIGAFSALLSGLLAIRFLLRYLSGHTLAVFAYYRIGLGALILLLALK